MKAIVHRRTGSLDVLEYEDVEKPIPREGEVLVKVRAASINPLDWRLVRVPNIVRVLAGGGRPKPGRPGVDVAGEVEAMGPNVLGFKAGDAVFGACRGAFAEYACASPTRLCLKPDNATFEQAACVAVAGVTALQGLRDKGKLQPGQEVLINGASGGVGTLAVPIARSMGGRVTGVCSGRNGELVRSLGADQVIDYTKEDFTRNGRRYDLIMDNVGNRSAAACRRALTPQGTCVIAGAPKGFAPLMGFLITSLLAGILLSRLVHQTFVPFTARLTRDDLSVLGELMKSGTVVPVIDRRYPLSEVREAMRYAEEGHVRGKVVLTV